MSIKRVSKSNLKLNFDPLPQRRDQASSFQGLKPKSSNLSSKLTQFDQQPNSVKVLTGQKYIGGQLRAQKSLNLNNCEPKKCSSTTMKGQNYIMKKQISIQDDRTQISRTPSSTSLYDQNGLKMKQNLGVHKSQDLSHIKIKRSLLATESSETDNKSSIISALVQRNKELRKNNIKKDNLIQKLMVDNQIEQKLSGAQSTRFQHLSIDSSQNLNVNFQTQGSMYNEFLHMDIIQNNFNLPKIRQPFKFQKGEPIELHKQNYSEPPTSLQTNQMTFRSPPSNTTQSDRDELYFTFSEINCKADSSKNQMSPEKKITQQQKFSGKANFKNLPIEFQIFPSQKKFFI